MKNKIVEEPIYISERALAHHMRYIGTSGFANPDGTPRVPTEREVVAHGWEAESYLTLPIPAESRSGMCGLGKTTLYSKLDATDKPAIQRAPGASNTAPDE